MESINPQTFTGQGATQGGGADPEGCAVISPLDSTHPCGCYNCYNTNPFNAIAVAL